MNSQTAGLKHDTQAWLDKLSEEQLAAVSPVLRGIGGMLATLAVSQAKSEEKPTAAATVMAIADPEAPFGNLEHRLKQALTTDDVAALREQIAACLEWARGERTRLSTSAARRDSLQTSPAPFKAPRIVEEDATTGLPTRLMFERTVSNVMADGRESVVALFVVERLVYINKRFGRQAGDEILLFVAQYLAQELPDAKCLCRWSGPAFAVLLNSQAATRKTEMQVRAISRKQLSHTIDTGGRSVMLPISCSCLVEFLNVENAPDSVFSKMDEFLSAHGSE